MGRELRYSEIVDRIDIDAMEEGLGWSPEYQSGDEDKGFCPFPENHMHGDTSGKFAINREKRIWGCWVCGGGNLLSLVMLMEDLDESAALIWLSSYATGDTRTDDDFVEEFLAQFEDVEKRVDVLPYFHPRSLERWESVGDEFLQARGISREVATEAHLAHTVSYRKPAPTGGKYANDDDFYGAAVIFPHFWYGRLVGWQVRWDDTERPPWVPKYVNTHDFPKVQTLYGWSFEPIFGNIVGVDFPVVLVESVPTALFLRSAGILSFATFGDSISEIQLRLLRRFQQGVALAPDNDKAGRQFLNTASSYLERYVPLYHIDPVPGEKSDLGDLAPDHDALYAQLATITLVN